MPNVRRPVSTRLTQEDRDGSIVLSREKARREEAWTNLEKAFEAQQRVNGTIYGRVKGGFTVDLGGAVAFLPGSQVDIRPVPDVGPVREALGIGMSGPGLLSDSITIYFKADCRPWLDGRQLGVIYVSNADLRGFFRFEAGGTRGFLAVRGTRSKAELRSIRLSSPPMSP